MPPLSGTVNAFGDLPDKSDRPGLVDLAVQLIEEHTSSFNPEVYKNSYEVALLARIKSKALGKRTPRRDTGELRIARTRLLVGLGRSTLVTRSSSCEAR
jgi:non-homologous end joining protein Ku